MTGQGRPTRIGRATPRRDGIDLAAREQVPSRNPDDPGVLVLSRLAGAAEQLARALRVDPADTGEVADALQRTLDMSPVERR